MAMEEMSWLEIGKRMEAVEDFHHSLPCLADTLPQLSCRIIAPKANKQHQCPIHSIQITIEIFFDQIHE